MNIAVEYMKHLVDGVLVDPEWVLEGGFFPNSSDGTYIGIALDRGSREYYIPDSVKIMDKSSIQTRNLKIDFPEGTTDNDHLTNASAIAQAWVEEQETN